MSVVDDSFNQPLKLEEHAAMPMAGGLIQGYQCGMLWGAALAAGAQAYRLWGPGPQAETGAVIASHKAVEAFRARTGEINCAAMLAQKMGASELHTVMAAGLAGGIGLSGGACGALGAAIWLIGLKRVQGGTGKVEYNSPEASEAID